MTQMIIRPAEPEDAEPLTAVFEAAYGPWIDRLTDLPDVTSEIDQDIAENMVWVASDEMDGPLMGGVVLFAPPDAAHITNLAVDPNRGGQGIGSALLGWAEEKARDMGYERLHLATHREMTPTLQFYQRNDWEITGRDGVRVFLQKDLT